MFEKTHSIKIDQFTVFPPGAKLESVLLCLGDSVVLINNSMTEIQLNSYYDDGTVKTTVLENDYGTLVSVLPHQNQFWLEFRETPAPYTEEYSIVKMNGATYESIAHMPRESYQHDFPYHSLFVQDDALYLHYLKHNRLHHYTINPKTNELEELDVMEGGKWFLCGDYPVCAIRDVLEIYDAELNICSTVEYDNEIDEINWGIGHHPDTFAVALSDFTQEQTALLVYQKEMDVAHITYIETMISDMGTSAGRVWLSPYDFQEQQDLGGCMIYDKYTWPVYIHLRAKGQNIQPIGLYPPPFHRSERIMEATGGITLVAERSRLLVFDYSCRPIKEIPLTHSAYFALSADGTRLAVLNADRNMMEGDEQQTAENITIDIYTFSDNPEDSKVIEIAKFTR